jgi:hypothetical protein
MHGATATCWRKRKAHQRPCERREPGSVARLAIFRQCSPQRSSLDPTAPASGRGS